MASTGDSVTGRPASLSDYHVHPFSLSFADRSLEARFLAEYASENLDHWRWCHVLAVLFYASFVVIHAVTIPAGTGAFLTIGFAFVAPMFVVGYLLTFAAWFKRRWQGVNVVYVLATGAGALAMAQVAGEQNSFFTLTGFFFCFLFGYAIIRLRFILASAAGAALTLTFLSMAPSLVGSRSAALPLAILYVCGFNLLGMIIAHGNEARTRRNFFLRCLLEAEMQSLDHRVKIRTEEVETTSRMLLEEAQRARALSTERDELRDRYLQAQRLETVGKLAGGIAHDFNNLIMIIMSFAAFVDAELSDDDPRKSDVRQILDAGTRAAGLTRQLLAFSRKQVLMPRVINLNEVILNLEKMLRRLLGEHISVKTALQPAVRNVRADPGQVEQVILNLAVNARDAMPEGGTLTIETGNVILDDEYATCHPETQPGKYVMLAVSDTGHGMSAETREHIFEPFFTTKERGRGTGLGLATAYGIVKQSGGSIWVYSEIGRGTTFKVYLPETDAVTHVDSQPAGTHDTRGTETILVVEDERGVRELAQRVLSSAGYDVMVASGGPEALAAYTARGAKVDLLLTDVVMPTMSGKELADRLASLAPDLRVLYMSGYTDNTIVHHGVLDEGLHFIAKPFNVNDLLKKVRNVLDSA